jgi:taurine---2-oxoglutarate transaminase
MSKDQRREKILEDHQRHVFFSWVSQEGVRPVIPVSSEGITFTDIDGKEWMDFSSMLMFANLGHNQPRIVDAVSAQMSELPLAWPGQATEVKGQLARKLAQITQGDLSTVLFTVGGAEAVENAIKIARMVTGRSKVLARYRSYHGASHGAMSVSGDPRRFGLCGMEMPGVIRVEDPYCYRCPFGKSGPSECSRECISHVERMINFEGPQNIAAIIMEGVTGSSGLIIPPDDYWPKIRELCDRHGILLISDEVMSGFGRTGKWFGVDHYGVVPDMICMAKGLTGGFLPLGAVIVREAIARHFDGNTLLAGLTHCGHPSSCAAALEAIAIYEDEDLIAQSEVLGHVLATKLAQIKENHRCVGDVRSMGLFSVIECVRDKSTREPLSEWNKPMSPEMRAIKASLDEQGLFTFVKWNFIFIVPPLVISEEELHRGLGIIDIALLAADKMLED